MFHKHIEKLFPMIDDFSYYFTQLLSMTISIIHVVVHFRMLGPRSRFWLHHMRILVIAIAISFLDHVRFDRIVWLLLSSPKLA